MIDRERNYRRGRSLLIGAVLLCSAMGAGAQQSTTPPKRPPADPNEKICEDITQTGSRLATKRICATRSEWEAKKQDDKDLVNQIQRSPCVKDEAGTCH